MLKFKMMDISTVHGVKNKPGFIFFSTKNQVLFKIIHIYKYKVDYFITRILLWKVFVFEQPLYVQL